MKFFERYINKKCKEKFPSMLKKYIKDLKIKNKIKSESSKYMVEISEADRDDFLMTYYLKTYEEAITLFKEQTSNGKRVEVWKLVKKS